MMSFFDEEPKPGLTKEEFDQVIDSVTDVYKDIVKDDHDAELNVRRHWENDQINAFASRSGNNYNVDMFGGMARHPLMSPDSFGLVMCHEVGHHIGGAPLKRSFFSSWASNEGQADYFASLKCMRKVLIGQDHEKVLEEEDVPTEVISACETSFPKPADNASRESGATEEQLICQRLSVAAKRLGNLSNELRGVDEEAKFLTPDENEVTRTDDNHPAGQCRLDSYYQGALCTVSHEIDVDSDDALIGTCNRAEGFEVGLRPLCWYKPESKVTFF